MRGLQARIALTVYRIENAISGVDKPISHVPSDDFFEVMLMALDEGYHDGIAGESMPPTMFMNEPQLLQWWKSGNRSAIEALDIIECHGCNNGTGHPCPTHG